MGRRSFQKVKWTLAEEYYLKHHKDHPVSQLSIALEKSFNAIKKKLKELEAGITLTTTVKKKQVSKIGRRPDCNNLFLRSSYEANFFRYMKHTYPNYILEYEPTTFSFAPFGVLKGTVSYTPDFKIYDKNNPNDYSIIEIKGFLRQQDKVKIKRFKKYYPGEFSKLSVVVPSEKSKTYTFFKEIGIEKICLYNELNKQYKNIIPNWE